jgi:hypothetical protein
MNGAAPFVSVLIFVEDPGAANYVASLPGILEQTSHIRSSVLARGLATVQLGSLNTDFQTLADDVSVEAIIGDQLPNLIIVGTSENRESLGLALIDFGNENNIPTIGVVDGPANPEHRFSGVTANPRNHEPEFVIVPNDQTRQALVALGYRTDNVINCGHPHYDFVREERRRLEVANRDELRHNQNLGPATNQDIVVFCAELSGGLAPQQYQRSQEYTMSGNAKHSERTQIVLDEFLGAIDGQKTRPYLVLRLHPKNNQEEFTEYLSSFDQISEGGSSLELVFCADLVVGMTSIILIEAALLGRPTISITPRSLERDWLPTIGLGITTSCTNRGELVEALGKSPTETAPDDKILAFGLPAQSAEKVCQLITSVLGRGTVDQEFRRSPDS